MPIGPDHLRKYFPDGVQRRRMKGAIRAANLSEAVELDNQRSASKQTVFSSADATMRAIAAQRNHQPHLKGLDHEEARVVYDVEAMK